MDSRTVAQCRQIHREILKNKEQGAAFQAARDAVLQGGDAMEWVRTETRRSRRKKKNARRAADKSGGGLSNVPEDNTIAMSSHK
jgi:hypothetical protein